MKNMKKIVAGMLVPLMMFSGIQVNAETSDAVELKLANPLVNIQVKDENGNLVNGSAFELYDSSNNKVASWQSGDETKAVCSEGVENISGKDQIETNKFCLDFERILGKPILGARTARYRPATGSDSYKSALSWGSIANKVKCKDIVFKYDCEYNLEMTYYEELPTALTIPAQTVRILNNSQNSKYVSFWLEKKEEGQDTITYKYPLEQSSLGTPVDYTIPVFDYEFTFWIGNSGGGNIYETLDVSDKSVEYCKTKIHLADVAGSSFTEEGLMRLNSEDQAEAGCEGFPRGYNILPDGKYVNCDFCIVSGSLIQLPKVDENGDVEIYVPKDTRRYVLHTGFSSGSVWRGPGITMPTQLYEDAKVSIKTPKFENEKNGITLNGLAEGQYKIVQTGCNEDNLPTEDTYINIMNTGTMQKITVVNKSKSKKTETTEATTEATTETTTEALKQEKPTGTETEKITVKQAEDIILASDFEKNDSKISQFQKLKLRMKTKKKGSKYSVELSWQKIKDADGYIIYGAKCGKKNKMKKITTIKNGNTNKWTQKNRKKGTYYKYMVVAFKGEDMITTSKSVHATTPGGKKGNPIGITNVKKTKLTLKIGDTYKIKAKVKVNKAYSKHVLELRYESENKDIASVVKGVIKANKSGETNIYIYTQNGISKKIKVKVK